MGIFSTIDAILFINLDHRTDRLENMNKQLYTGEMAKQLGLPKEKIHRISGIYNKKCGASGCAASHIKALNMAIDNCWERIIILEDDFAWKTNRDYIFDCLGSIDTIPWKWDVIMLSTNKKTVHTHKEEGAEEYNLQRIKKAHTTSGYIVNSIEYITKIRDIFQLAMENLNAGRNDRIWAIDVVWQRLQVTGQWYFFKGGLGKQISSLSDITKRVEYKGSDPF